MPVDLKEFMDGLAILADNHNLRVTVQKSGKGALICGTCCFIGGLVAGPVGLAIGGTVGGITAYKSAGRMLSRFSLNSETIKFNSFFLSFDRFPFTW